MINAFWFLPLPHENHLDLCWEIVLIRFPVSSILLSEMSKWLCIRSSKHIYCTQCIAYSVPNILVQLHIHSIWWSRLGLCIYRADKWVPIIGMYCCCIHLLHFGCTICYVTLCQAKRYRFMWCAGMWCDIGDDDDCAWSSFHIGDSFIIIDLLLMKICVFTGLPARLCQVNEMSSMLAGTGMVKCNAYSFVKPSRT